MTNPASRRRAGKQGESRADIPMPPPNATGRSADSSDEFTPWLYLNNYKASYFLM
jgi:hypothetical protein